MSVCVYEKVIHLFAFWNNMLDMSSEVLRSSYNLAFVHHVAKHSNVRELEKISNRNISLTEPGASSQLHHALQPRILLLDYGRSPAYVQRKLTIRQRYVSS